MAAIEFDERRGVSVVNAALCKGCGSCAGFCPSSAAQVAQWNGVSTGSSFRPGQSIIVYVAHKPAKAQPASSAKKAKATTAKKASAAPHKRARK